MLQRWRAVGNAVSDLIGLKFEPQTFRFIDERVTAWATGRLTNRNKLAELHHRIASCNHQSPTNHIIEAKDFTLYRLKRSYQHQHFIFLIWPTSNTTRHCAPPTQKSTLCIGRDEFTLCGDPGIFVIFCSIFLSNKGEDQNKRRIITSTKPQALCHSSIQ